MTFSDAIIQAVWLYEQGYNIKLPRYRNEVTETCWVDRIEWIRSLLSRDDWQALDEAIDEANRYA